MQRVLAAFPALALVALYLSAVPITNAQQQTQSDVAGAASSAASKPAAASAPRRACGSNHQLPDEDEQEASRLVSSWSKMIGANTTEADAHRQNVPSVRIFWHQITSGGKGSISKPTMQAQLDVLNKDYAGIFSFQLAGYDRTENPSWFAMQQGSPEETAMKTKLRKGYESMLNVYTLQPGDGTILGWSTYPQEYTKTPPMDGVVINYRTVPGGGMDPFSKGRTLTHESGHWFGLYHPFQGGCQDPGDQVNDTPKEATPTYGCPAQRQTCNGVQAAIHNFMDYEDDACMNNFTPGQITRMKGLSTQFRKLM